MSGGGGFSTGGSYLRKNNVATIVEKASTSKRRKTVFPTAEIPHLWAHKTTPEAHNPQKNLFVIDNTIYSYGTHFPIATHVTGKNGGSAVLLTTVSHSHTTSGHVSMVRSAIPSGMTIFRIPLRSAHDYQAALEHYKKRVDGVILKLSTCRSYVDSYLTDWHNLLVEAKQYTSFFGLEPLELRTPSSKGMRAVLKTARERAQKWDASREKRRQREREERAAWDKATPAQREKMVHAEELRRQERILKEQEAKVRKHHKDIERWKAGGQVYLGFQLPHPIMRIEGDELVTSQGARVLVTDAARVIPLVIRAWRSGRTWTANGEQILLGHYRIDRITPEGLIAGCHNFLRAEVERVMPLVQAAVKGS